MGVDEMKKVGKKYWVWLSLALGAEPRTDEIFSAYKNPLEIYKASLTDRINSGVFTKKQMESLAEVTVEEAEEVLVLCEGRGWNIITPEDTGYPAGLRKTRDMPFALYIDGDITCLQGKVVIGVVGTRNPGIEGVTVTHDICTDLALAGAVVVSGGALGIDSAAHEAAIFAEGKTVCVLGCGLGTNYLMENEALRRSIAKNGAVISEYPPFTPATKFSFPQRNRLISGMSHGVLVVEANEKSGSLITAKAAMTQKRELFAVPGSALSSAYTGANRLIAKGAKAVTGADEILEPYAAVYPERLQLELIGTKKYGKKDKNEEMPEGFDSDMQKVYACLGEEPVHFDDIIASTGLDYSKVTTAILQLGLSDMIDEPESKKYTLK